MQTQLDTIACDANDTTTTNQTRSEGQGDMLARHMDDVAASGYSWLVTPILGRTPVKSQRLSGESDGDFRVRHKLAVDAAL